MKTQRTLESRLLARVGAVVLALVMGSSAMATELKLADQFPATHTISKEGTQAFLDHIKAHPEVDLSVTHYPAEQLGKAASMLDLVRNRVTDIAMVGMSYITERMPLATMMDLPGLYNDSFDGYSPFVELARNDLAGIDFDRNNVKMLWVVVTPPYQLLLKRSDPIDDLSDLAGTKTRVAGATGELAAAALGLVPIQMPAPDLYVSLERGTIDAAIYTLSAMRSYKLEEVTNSFTTNAALGGVAFATFIHKDVWNRLTPEQQKVIEEGAEKAQFASACALLKSELAAQEALKGMGKAVYDLPDAVLAQFQERLAAVDKTWADQMASRNLPGAEMLSKFRSYQQRMRDDGSSKAAYERCVGA
jgi:TRAP-type C4-dicarboxylate transport system substrate-binding protein